ncbi:hypothetical protein, partial [Serratia marcescens]|uniref:hypothetical protein n=1 Tax=Serratia marcescens TaxID=615 RepID=UPI0019540D29
PSRSSIALAMGSGMAAQSLMMTCDLLIITTLLAMMFSAQISHSNNVNMCIKHCVSNQCLLELVTRQ